MTDYYADACPASTNKRYARDLTDEQWKIFDSLIPKPITPKILKRGLGESRRSSMSRCAASCQY
jgi:hypothetical protein